MNQNDINKLTQFLANIGNVASGLGTDKLLIYRESLGANRQLVSIDLTTLATFVTLVLSTKERLINMNVAAGGTTVVFAIPFADANWQWSGVPLCIETASGSREEPVITNKTANGFTIQLASATAGTVEGKIIHA
jgi:hypothetical protein